jgi:hypothetical protein
VTDQILNVAQLLVDLAGLVKRRRNRVEDDGSPYLVLLNIQAKRQSLMEPEPMEQGSAGHRRAMKCPRRPAKRGGRRAELS